MAEYEAQDAVEMKEAGKWYAEQIQKKEEKRESDEIRIRKKMLEILQNRS